jgi:hypothetical protein
MDQSYTGAYRGPDYQPTGRNSLHKKRSLVRMRSGSLVEGRKSRPATTTAFRTDRTDSRDAGFDSHDGLNESGQRKGSIRDVVRKIFGRSRSKRVATPNQQRHAYHRSEPHGLPPPRDSFNDVQEDAHRAPHRILSTPLTIAIPPVLGTKVRSPYAVEFPNSARLKPLDISSPFEVPGAAVRRRKTLPTLLVSGQDAAAIEPVSKRADVPPIPAKLSAEQLRPTTSEIGLALSETKESKRRSRSAGGMSTRDSGVADEPARKRSAEIRFWRESYQGNVLRASGFTVPCSVPPPDEHERDDKWQAMQDQSQEPFTPPTELSESPGDPRVNSQSRQDTVGTLDGSTQLNFRSTSGLSSRDLEERVTQLEANVQYFQRSLHKMQAERNRRTVIVGDYPSPERRKSHRTPSMLADDLHTPTNYLEKNVPQEPETLRPATASPLPRSPIAQYPPVPPLPGQSNEFPPDSPTRDTRPSNARKPSNLIISNPTVTFKSLYQMLADERSARRRLETQMRTLHTDIQDLQQQVSLSPYSQRNSYMISHEATIGSSRLRELLRGTESEDNSPEHTPRKEIYVSRFSASTAGPVQEADGDTAGAFYDDDDDAYEEDEAQTPQEEYKTPKEEQSPFKFERDGIHDGLMF